MVIVYNTHNFLKDPLTSNLAIYINPKVSLDKGLIKIFGIILIWDDGNIINLKHGVTTLLAANK